MYSTVQYACLFPTPLEHWSLATAHIYYVDEGVTEGRMSNRSERKRR